MDPTAKCELATAIVETNRVREESYAGSFRYGLSWHAAAEKACTDPDLVPLVYAMCVAGYAEFPEWGERILKWQLAA